MVAVKGYFDSSRDDEKRLLTVAGYAGDEDQWNRFLPMWKLALDKHKVPYFHAKEIKNPLGLYSKWHPLEQHEDELKYFSSDLLLAIGVGSLNLFFASVIENDLKQFNKDYRKPKVNALALAIYALLLQIYHSYPNQIIELVFDHETKIESRLILAKQYAKSDERYPGLLNKMGLWELPGDLSWRNVKELQAADFAAWEIRRHHRDLTGWLDDPNLPGDPRERWEHLIEWSRRNFNGRLYKRTSLDFLFSYSPHQGGIWDYQTLCRVHKARGGVW